MANPSLSAKARQHTTYGKCSARDCPDQAEPRHERCRYHDLEFFARMDAEIAVMPTMPKPPFVPAFTPHPSREEREAYGLWQKEYDYRIEAWLREWRRTEGVKFMSAALIEAMGLEAPAPEHLPDEDADFVAWSNSKGRLFWPMVFTPEGYAVHQGEGCLGELNYGVLKCHHSKENTREISA